MAAVLVDTHVLLWILSNSPRLKELSWFHQELDWTVSPISLLELKFLDECGKIRVDVKKVSEGLSQDERFIMNDVSLEELCKQAWDLNWTRDPFDRLLVAHSLVRSIPLGTVDQLIRKNYSLIMR